MKDKLVKHHKSKFYFKARRICGIFFILVGMTAAVAVPLGITIYKELHIHEVSK